MKLLPLNLVKIGEMKTVLFTEKVVRKYLFANTENRPLNKAEVQRYVWDMQHDCFDWGAIPICVCKSKNGRGLILADGQTRLYAMIQAGVFNKKMFVRGISREQRQYLNGGRHNSFHDRKAFGCAPTATPADEKVILSYIKLVQDKMPSQSDFISPARVVQVYSGVEDFVTKMQTSRRFSTSRKRKVPHGIFVALLERHVSDDDENVDGRILQFLDRFCCPNMQNESSAEKLHAVISYYLEETVRLSGSRTTNAVYMATKEALDFYLKDKVVPKSRLKEIIGIV